MKWSSLLFFCLLVLSALIVLACGSNPTNRAVQSLEITPAAADAQDYPDGQVPFTAIGVYNNSQLSPVEPTSATWGACYQNAASTAVTVSTSGVAHCAHGASGVYTVWAYVMTSKKACPNWVTACGGGGCQITGTAQLTCP